MKTLRQLAKEHALGHLPMADYRKNRNELIRNILTGDIEVTDHKFEAPVAPVEEDITEQSGFDPLSTTQMSTVPNHNLKKQARKNDAVIDAVSEDLQSKTKESQHQNKLNLLFIATLLVLFIVIGLSYLFLTSDSDNPAQPDTSGTTDAAQPAVTTLPSDDLIAGFLSNNDWQESSLNNFIQSWQNLSPAVQQQALGSTRLNQLGNAVYKKLLEERALMDLGDKDISLSRQNKLIEFARSTGIDDPRINIQVQ